MRPTSPLFSLLLGLALGSTAFAPAASANCYCSGGGMEGEVPLEGLLVLPNDSCSNESRSMWMTDEDGVGVLGRIDLEIASFQATSNIYWRPDAPLSPGASSTKSLR